MALLRHVEGTKGLLLVAAFPWELYTHDDVALQAALGLHRVYDDLLPPGAFRLDPTEPAASEDAGAIECSSAEVCVFEIHFSEGALLEVGIRGGHLTNPGSIERAVLEQAVGELRSFEATVTERAVDEGYMPHSDSLERKRGQVFVHDGDGSIFPFDVLCSFFLKNPFPELNESF